MAKKVYEQADCPTENTYKFWAKSKNKPFYPKRIKN
jgi:hypothetical protein